jgi:C4-dicarboxylate-specific signal transduction histidine kinase
VENGVALRGRRILVADDERLNRELLEAILRPQGYDVSQVCDGAAALEVVAARGADLLLLDVMMPGLDGIETCARIRGELGQTHLPIVVITALSDRAVRIRAMQVGADDFLSKPVDEIELSIRVKNLLTVKAYHEIRERQCELVEDELEKTRAQLLRAERLATLGTLAAGVGHELANAAAVFGSALSMVRENVAQGLAPDPEDLQALQSVGDHIRTHASQLLALGRPGPDYAQEIDMREVIRATLAVMRTTGRTKYIEVVADLPESPVPVLASRTRLEQVLVNLVSNAADALEGVKGRPKRIRVHLGHEAESGTVRCEVQDTGTGIPEAHLASLFEPYFTTKSPERGTGLGLAVVRQILTALGGDISVASREGEGSVFTFEIPSEQKPEQARPVP